MENYQVVVSNTTGGVSTFSFGKQLADETWLNNIELRDIGGEFNDVSRWAEDYITYLVARGIINGVGNSKFAPENNITRAQFAKMLAGTMGADVSGYKTSKFTDVGADSFYAPSIAWAADKGIVNGVDSAKYDPNANITREQMTVMLTRIASEAKYILPEMETAVTFKDSTKISAYAKDSVAAIQCAGIINGKTGNFFDPQAGATRAETAKMLSLFMQGTIK